MKMGDYELYEFLGDAGRDASEGVKKMAMYLYIARAETTRLNKTLDESMKVRAELRRMLNESYRGKTNGQD